MRTMIEKYRCDECGSIHENVDGATTCCDPAISEVYECSVCHQVFDDEDVANGHFCEPTEAEPEVPSHAELERHGQQRLPL